MVDAHDDFDSMVDSIVSVHDADTLRAEHIPYLPAHATISIHIAWCPSCFSRLPDKLDNDEAPQIDRRALQKRIEDANRATTTDWIRYVDGYCKNRHDTSICGRYKDTGKCVTCVSEQGRRQWQKRKRQPLYKSVEMFMTKDELQRRRAFESQTPDWKLPREPELLANELRTIVPAYLCEMDKLDTIAELILIVVKHGYVVNRKLLSNHAKKYARELPNRYTVSTDDYILGTDGMLRISDVLEAPY